MFKQIGGAVSGLLSLIPMSDKAMEKQAARMERADRLAANPVVGAAVGAFAWTENAVSRAVKGQPISGQPPDYGSPKPDKPRGGFSRNHALSVAEGMQDHLYSVLRPGQVIVAGGRKIVVIDTEGESVTVRSGRDLYEIDIDVSASTVELKDEEGEDDEDE